MKDTRNLKRLLAMGLSTVMCLSMLPMTALAYDTNVDAIQSVDTAVESVESANTALESAGAFQSDAEAAGSATGDDTLIGAVIGAAGDYLDAVDPDAAEIISNANDAIRDLESETNTQVEDLNNAAGDALAGAQDALDAIRDDAGGITDVKAAENAAQLAASAAKAAEEIFNDENASVDDKREAAGAAQEAANLAQEAVDLAQETLDSARAQVDQAREAYEQAQRDYAELIGQANQDLDDIKSDDQVIASEDIIKAANEALDAARETLAEAGRSEGDALSAVESAQAALDQANASAEAASQALVDANIPAISESLGVADITGMTAEDIDKAAETSKSDAKIAFEQAYKAVDNHLIDSLGDKAFAKLEQVEISVDDLIALQARLDEAHAARDAAQQAYDDAAWYEKIMYQGALTSAQFAYDAVYSDIASALGLGIVNQTDVNRHPVIYEIFRAKTNYEIDKANADLYAEAAKAVTAAQAAKSEADAAKQAADEAMANYNAAKAALESAKAGELLASANFNSLKDLEQAFLDASAELEIAQANLDDANSNLDEANEIVQEILDSLPEPGQTPDPDDGSSDDDDSDHSQNPGDAGDSDPDADQNPGAGGTDGDDDSNPGQNPGTGDDSDSETAYPNQNPNTGFDFDSDTDDGLVTIEDTETPLADGPMTRAMFVNYIWEYFEMPDVDTICDFTDVLEDYEFILALSWAWENGLITAVDVGLNTFEPDSLITVKFVRDTLQNVLDLCGIDDFEAGTLDGLAGEDLDLVMNGGTILTVFFARLDEYDLVLNLTDLAA